MSSRPLPPRELGAALYLRGQASYGLGELYEAIVDWRRALEEGELDASQAEALRQNLARLETYLADDERGGDAGLAANLLQLAREAFIAEDYGRAQDLATRALAAAEASGDSALLLDALVGLGSVATQLGQFDAALTTFQRAAAMSSDQGNDTAYLVLLTSLGEAAIAADRMDVAADAYRRGVEIGERLEADAGVMERFAVERAYDGLGYVALSNHQYADAGRYFSRALELSENHQEWNGDGTSPPPFEARAETLANAALAALLQGDTAQAERRLEQLRREAAERDDAPIAARTIETASELAEYLEEEEAACTLERRSRNLYADLGLTNDADDMRIIMEQAGCPDPALRTDPE
jgi:tetratricopeptide (TPR) repeat protein